MKKNVVLLFYPAPWPGEARGRTPYALLYLERMIRDFGLKIILIEEQIQQDYVSIIAENKDRLLLAGVSAMTGHQIFGGIKFSKAVKELSKNCLTVWGGWQATLLPEQTLIEPYIDVLVMGQGENPFRQLVERILNGESFHDLKNIAYKESNRIVVNSIDKFVDINCFPKIDYSLVNINDYVFKSAYSERCIGYFSSHGCPYNCAFCCVAEIYGRKWYNKNIQDIIADLKYFKEIAQIDSISFDDDNFFVNKNFTIDFCKELINSGLNLLWDTSAHAGLFLKLFSEADIDLFYQAGCRQIYIGAESGDQEMLDLISKKATVEDNFHFVEVLNRHQITPLFSTMVCFPVNPDKDLRLTIEMVRKSKLIDKSLRTRMFFYTPYPGTELYKRAIEKGFNPPTKLEDWAYHTLRKFHAPWWTRDYRYELEIFINFYLPLANPSFYKYAPKKFRSIAYIVNKIFYPIVNFRFITNFFKFPLEAITFLFLLKTFNKLMKTKIALGFESYFD